MKKPAQTTVLNHFGLCMALRADVGTPELYYYKNGQEFKKGTHSPLPAERSAPEIAAACGQICVFIQTLSGKP